MSAICLGGIRYGICCLLILMEICGIDLFAGAGGLSLGARLAGPSILRNAQNPSAKKPLTWRAKRSTVSLRMQQSLGEKIKELRLKLAVSVRELARRIGISAPFLSDIELGRRFPSPDVLLALAKKLVFSEDELAH